MEERKENARKEKNRKLSLATTPGEKGLAPRSKLLDRALWGKNLRAHQAKEEKKRDRERTMAEPPMSGRAVSRDRKEGSGSVMRETEVRGEGSDHV